MMVPRVLGYGKKSQPWDILAEEVKVCFLLQKEEQELEMMEEVQMEQAVVVLKPRLVVAASWQQERQVQAVVRPLFF